MATTSTPVPNRAERRRTKQEQDEQTALALRAMELLLQRGCWYELFTLPWNNGAHYGYDKAHVKADGYFRDNAALMLKEGQRLGKRGNNVYFHINPVSEELSHRAPNYVVDYASTRAKADQIAHRHLLLVEVDPERASAIAATDEQHAAALEKIEKSRAWLMEDFGWPASVVFDSGNGAQQFFRVDLANTPESTDLLSRVLKAIAAHCDREDDIAKIDTGVSSADQLARMPLPKNRKGDGAAPRPHRPVRVLIVPGRDELEVVSREQLEQVARTLGPEAKDKTNGQAAANDELDEAVVKAIEPLGITVRRHGNGKYPLSRCLYDPSHDGSNNTSVAIIAYPMSKVLAYCCKHPGCSKNGKSIRLWSDVLKLLGLEDQTKQPNNGLKTIIEEIPDVLTLAAEKVEFVIPKLIPKGTLTVISAPSESGKTTFTVWICYAVATGDELFGEQCEMRSILFLTRENPDSFIADIVKRLGIKQGPHTGFYFWGDWMDEYPPLPDSEHILAWVRQCEVKPVVVVDSLIAFFDGDNENDAKQMRAFLNRSRFLLKAGAAAVIVLAHPGKSETAQETRGSSDIKPAIDTGYKMTNTGDGKLDRILLKAFKARFSQQKREMVVVYTHNYTTGHDTFVSDERPQAVAESYKQVLTNLLQQNPDTLKTAFEREAVAKGATLVQVREWVNTGIACGTILVNDGIPQKARTNKKRLRLAPRMPESDE